MPWIIAALILAAAFLTAELLSIKYSVENDKLIIKSGILIKKKRIVKFSAVLWKTAVKIGTKPLFTVLHTASGKLIVFAEMK